MSITIRPETPADYAHIARIHVHAFDNRIDEAGMVALQRQSSRYDPDLALVAVIDGQVIGHALFSPLTLRLLDTDVEAVLLGPIAVDPAHQGRGIGAVLMRNGHDQARSQGYAFAFLLGHPSYYPRFGYQQHAFGASSVQIAPPDAGETLACRPPLPADVPALMDLWRHEEHAVDMAVVPGRSLVDWLSPNPQIKAYVYLRGDEVVGFARIHDAEPASPRVFLARDTPAARAMAAQIGAGLPELTLPLHPRSASAAAFDAQPSAQSWDAAMVLPLRQGLFDRYHAQVQAGERPPGRPVFPPAFDLG